MIQMSEAFAAQMGSNARKIAVRFLLDGTEVEGNIKEVTVNKGACGDGEFTVGSVYSSYITATIDDCPTPLENKELELQVGLELSGGTVEYCTVGFYTASDVATSVGSTTFTGVGRLSAKFGGGYFSEKSWPQSVGNVLDEIAQQTGVSIDVSACDSGIVSMDIETSMNGLLHREAVMYIAGLLGGFATESNTGGVVIKPFSSTAAVEMDSDRTTEMYEFSDYDYTVTGVTVLVSAGGEKGDGDGAQEVSYSYGTPNLTLSNPYMTKAIFDKMAPSLTGFAYRPGTVPISMGDIRLEAGDVVTAVDTARTGYAVPCLNLVHTYDGGLMTTVTAPGDSDTEREAAFTGAVSAAVERTATELLVVKKVVATKASITDLEATNAEIQHLKAAAAELENAVIGKAEIDDLHATNAEVETLKATKADITDLNAANANINTLTADVANINSVLAGNVGTGNLQAVHITGDNVVIDDAVITDAMIAGLSAGKLTAGTIYTSLIRIVSDQDENLAIDGSTIQIKDNQGTVRVQIGKDGAGDYNLALWDAAGQLMWDASGAYAAGLHDGIIRDIAVAEDANIAGSKLDISSVAERLNADGSLTVDAGHVTVDNTTLDVAYKSVTTATEAVQAGVDAVTRRTSALETDLTVVQGQIASKVWQSDITEVATSLGDKLTTLTDEYSEVSQTVDGIQSQVGAVTTQLATKADASEVSTIQSSVSKLEQRADSITLSATGSLGGTAQIKLSGDGVDQTADVDLSAVRQAFADDTSEVAVSAGKITYNAGTLVINAGNFTLDADGNMTATNGTFGGTITATSGSIGGLQVATTSDSTQHTYGNSIYTQTINVAENVWNHSEGDNATKTVYLDTEFGIKPVTSLGSLSSYLIAKPHSTANWTNDLILYSVSGRGAVKCSGLTVYPRRPLEYNDGEITYTDSEFACIETDNEYMTLNNVKFVTGGIGGIYSDMDPGKSNAYDMGGASYYWRAIYVKTVHRSSESNLSDRRQKKDIIPLPEDYRSFVLGLTPVQYRWREDGDRLHAGFIAQDVAAAAQSTVGDCGVWQVWDRRTDDDVSLHYADTPEDDQIWSYSPDEILSPLVAVVQQQDQRISTMEDTISQLTQRLAALERKLTGEEV